MIDTTTPWTKGYVVLSGITGGQRVALSYSQRVEFRVKPSWRVEFDRAFKLSAVISGADAQLDILDEECALLARVPLGHFVGRAETVEHEL